ncbi:hypothetical protein [Almyronema epifaneia]|uniref:Uncharacterized protein n=1 Tax=Almyronema epifaneia S1 TaxID=2991925 RepID=A0ABW6IHN6_9CYAN
MPNQTHKGWYLETKLSLTSDFAAICRGGFADNGSTVSTPEVVAFILNQAKIPARGGKGILLTAAETYATSFVQWLEGQNAKAEWQAHDSVNLSFGEQTRYLPWGYGLQQAIAAALPKLKTLLAKIEFAQTEVAVDG